MIRRYSTRISNYISNNNININNNNNNKEKKKLNMCGNNKKINQPSVYHHQHHRHHHHLQQQQQQHHHHHQRHQRNQMKKNHVSIMGTIFLLTILMDVTWASWWQLHTVHTPGALETSDSLHQSQSQICQNFIHLSPEQKRICSTSKSILEVIALGAKSGKDECQHQFRHSRWNCTAAPSSVSLYGGVTAIKSRETAYIHAINSAALAWSITRACSSGKITECSCDNTKRKKQRKWQWGGCSEDINYGVMFSRKFTDSQEDNKSDLGLMNLHNNEAGRRALRSRMQRVCKCHGMSGSCSVKVCWRRLPLMRTVGEALGSLYDGASHVKVVEREGKLPKLRRRDPDHKKLIKSDLVYLEDSPDYCERNEELGILGTRGRLCNRTSQGIDGCRLLCCGRGYQTRIRHVEEKCNCKFVWCCNVKCEMCNYRREEHICN